MGAAAIPLALAGGAALGGLFGGDKPTTKQVSTQTPQQRQIMDILSQLLMSRMGRTIRVPGPEGRRHVFEYDPQVTPQYPGQVVAPPGQLQQQGMEQASQLGNLQSQLMAGTGGGYGDFFSQLAQYKPGAAAAGKLPSPTRQPTTAAAPYQMDPLAMRGTMLPRPPLPQEEAGPQYFWGKGPGKPAAYVDPWAQKARPQAWRGTMGSEQIAGAMEKAGPWQPEWGNVPKAGYLKPKPKRGAFDWGSALTAGALTAAVFPPATLYAGYAAGEAGRGSKRQKGKWPIPGEQYSPFYPGFAQGGRPEEQMPNLVGEAGPEMHLTDTGMMNMVGEQGPELFYPGMGGTIIPNYMLSAPLNASQGPQQPTGQELPLPPGQMGQNLATSLTGAGMGRQAGGTVLGAGPTLSDQGLADPSIWEGTPWAGQAGTMEPENYRYSYGAGGQETKLPYFGEWGGLGGTQGAGQQYRRYYGAQGPGAEIPGQFAGQYGSKSTPAGVYSQYGALPSAPRYDYSNSPWAYQGQGGAGAGSPAGWYAPGLEAGQYADWSPQGVTTDPRFDNQLYMAPSYGREAPLTGWEWGAPTAEQQPLGGQAAGQGMWAPGGFEYEAQAADATTYGAGETAYDYSGLDWQWDPTGGYWGAGRPAEGERPDLLPSWMTEYPAYDQYRIGAETEPRAEAGVSGWQWAEPGEYQTGQAMYAPEGFTGFGYEGAPAPDQYETLGEWQGAYRNWAAATGQGTDAASLTAATTAAEAHFTPDITDTDTRDKIDPWAGFVAPDLDVEAPERTMGLKEWWMQNDPEAWQTLQDLKTADPYYEYDPEAVEREWERIHLNPAMTTWQEDVTPWIREQFLKTGNITGGALGKYLARRTQKLYTDLQATHGEMQMAGQDREFQAATDLTEQKRWALEMETGPMAELPIKANFAQAQIDQIYSGMQIDVAELGLRYNEVFAGVNMAAATTAEIYERVKAAAINNASLADMNAVELDAKIIENMVSWAYLPMLETSIMGQQIQNIGRAMATTALMTQIGAETEQQAAQWVLTATYQDWVNALGPYGQSPEQGLMELLGLPTSENIVMNPQTDYSGQGAVTGALINYLLNPGGGAA